jgi:tetratricopeptide (TPR) repeat protein
MLRIYQNDFDGAEVELERSREFLGDDPIIDSNQALLWARRGEAEQAEACLVRASQPRHSLGHIHHTWYHAALACSTLGQTQKAIEYLRRAATTGFPNYPLFRDDPLLVPLRKDPEMKQLLRVLENDWKDFQKEFGGSG